MRAPSSLLSLLSLPVIPGVLGFDPRLQVIHAEDLVGALAHAVSRGARRGLQRGRRRRARPLRGALAAGQDAAADPAPVGDGLCRGPAAPPRPARPGRARAPAALRPRAGQPPPEGERLPVSLHEPRGAHPVARPAAPAPAARAAGRVLPLRARPRGVPALESERAHHARAPEAPEPDRAAATGFDALGVGELIDLIPSLEREALRALHRYETEHQQRAEVLDALDRSLARKG